MGIIVTENKEVFFDPTKEVLVNTSISSNPKSQRYKNVLVYSLFQRLHTRSNNQVNLNDGNPLINALKKKGYSISREEKEKISQQRDRILIKLNQKICNFDEILCIPSSSSIVYETALSIQKNILETSNMSLPIYDCFEKKTVDEIYTDLLSETIPGKYKKSLNATLASLLELKNNKNAKFEMKHVDQKIRPYLSVLKVKEDFTLCSNKSYIFVEDLISSGSTINSAIQCLLNHNIPEDNILGISLLSKI